MKIRYNVYFKDYENKKAIEIGFFIDFWQEISFERGRVLARKYFRDLVKDVNAIFVLAEKVR